MTLVNPDTGEIVDVTYGAVRESVRVARESGTRFFEQIVWQIECEAWTVLGHTSWDAMREAEYGDMGVVVPRADRPEIVARMRRTGLTQKEIANTIGVSEATVSRQLADESSTDLPDVIETPRGPRPTSYATKTPEPTIPQGEPVSRDVGSGSASGDLAAHIEASPDVALAGWRRSFMGAIARSGEVMRFTPEDVVDKADVDLINEVERLATDLNNYVSRIHARRPNRLTAIRGGAQ